MSLTEADFSVVGGEGSSDFVLKARGDIDVPASEQLRHVLDGVLAAGPTRVVMDLSDVTSTDAAGWAVILAALDEAQGRGIELLVQGASTEVMGAAYPAHGDPLTPRRQPGVAAG